MVICLYNVQIIILTGFKLFDYIIIVIREILLIYSIPE